MTPNEISKLTQGDVVRHTATGAGYIVLSNRTGVPTVVRSIEIHNAREWEHIYTTTPVVAPPIAPPIAPPSISIVEMIMELEKLGWTFSVKPHQWISPDGVFRTELAHCAWLFRNDYPKPFKGAVVPVFSQRRSELLAAGWRQDGPNSWRSPSWEFFSGSYRAWLAMDAAKVFSFAEVRLALRNAGWKNPHGKVWRSPKGEFFSGARAAYAAMTGGDNPS